MFAEKLDEARREVDRADHTQRFEDNPHNVVDHEAAVAAFLAQKGETLDKRHDVKSRRQLQRETDRTVPAFMTERKDEDDADFTDLASGQPPTPAPARRNGRPKKAKNINNVAYAYDVRALLQDGIPRSKADILARFAASEVKLTDYAFRQVVESLGLVQTRAGFQGQVLYSLP